MIIYFVMFAVLENFKYLQRLGMLGTKGWRKVNMSHFTIQENEIF